MSYLSPIRVIAILICTFSFWSGLETSVQADGEVPSLVAVDPDLEDAVNILIPALTDRNLKIVYGDLYAPILNKLTQGKGMEVLMKADDSKTVLKPTFIKIKPPFISVTTPKHDFVIIPTLSKFNLDQSHTQTIAHILSTGYIMAIRDHGSNKWQFVYDFVMKDDPMDHTNPRTVYFPDLPASVVLPEIVSRFVNS